MSANAADITLERTVEYDQQFSGLCKSNTILTADELGIRLGGTQDYSWRQGENGGFTAPMLTTDEIAKDVCGNKCKSTLGCMGFVHRSNVRTCVFYKETTCDADDAPSHERWTFHKLYKFIVSPYSSSSSSSRVCPSGYSFISQVSEIAAAIAERPNMNLANPDFTIPTNAHSSHVLRTNGQYTRTIEMGTPNTANRAYYCRPDPLPGVTDTCQSAFDREPTVCDTSFDVISSEVSQHYLDWKKNYTKRDASYSACEIADLCSGSDCCTKSSTSTAFSFNGVKSELKWKDDGYCDDDEGWKIADSADECFAMAVHEGVLTDPVPSSAVAGIPRNGSQMEAAGIALHSSYKVSGCNLGVNGVHNGYVDDPSRTASDVTNKVAMYYLPAGQYFQPSNKLESGKRAGLCKKTYSTCNDMADNFCSSKSKAFKSAGLDAQCSTPGCTEAECCGNPLPTTFTSRAELDEGMHACQSATCGKVTVGTSDDVSPNIGNEYQQNYPGKFYQSLTFSPDGSKALLLQAKGAKVLAFDADGQYVEILSHRTCFADTQSFAHYTDYAVITPDGQFAYTWYGGKIKKWAIAENIWSSGEDLSGINKRAYGQPAISSDGKFMYIPAGDAGISVLEIAENGDLTEVQLVLWTGTGKNYATVTGTDAEQVESLVISPTGDFVYTLSDRANIDTPRATHQYVRWSRNEATGELTYVDSLLSEPDTWLYDNTMIMSPDGKYLYAYGVWGTNSVDRYHRIVTVKVDATGLSHVNSPFALGANNPARPASLKISPEGSYIIVNYGDHNGVLALKRIERNKKTGALKALSTDAEGINEVFEGRSVPRTVFHPSGKSYYSISYGNMYVTPMDVNNYKLEKNKLACPWAGDKDFCNPTQWNVASVNDLSNLFAGMEGFPANVDLSSWNVQGKNIAGMFANTKGGLASLAGLDNWAVTGSLAGFLKGTKGFSVDITGWDTAAVTDLSSFAQNSDFNQDLDGWDTSNVKDFGNMLAATAYNQDLSMWSVASATNTVDAFEGKSCIAVEAIGGSHAPDTRANGNVQSLSQNVVTSLSDGSTVSGNAVMSPDGKHYYVNYEQNNEGIIYFDVASDGSLSNERRATPNGASSYSYGNWQKHTLTITPDGKDVYIHEYIMITQWRRNSETGQLTFVKQYTRTGNGGSMTFDGGLAYQMIATNNNLYAIDQTRMDIVDRDPSTGVISNGRSITWSGKAQYGAELSLDEKFMYLRNADTGIRVYSRDTSTGDLQEQTGMEFSYADGDTMTVYSLMMNDEGTKLFAFGENKFRQISVNTADGSLTYVGLYDTGNRIGRINVGYADRGIGIAHGNIYASGNYGEVFVYSQTTGAQIDTFKPVSPTTASRSSRYTSYDLQFSSDGSRLYIPDQGNKPCEIGVYELEVNEPFAPACASGFCTNDLYACDGATGAGSSAGVCGTCPVPFDMKAVPVGTKVVCEDTSVACTGDWLPYGGGCYHPTCTDVSTCCGSNAWNAPVEKDIAHTLEVENGISANDFESNSKNLDASYDSQVFATAGDRYTGLIPEPSTHRAFVQDLRNAGFTNPTYATRWIPPGETLGAFADRYGTDRIRWFAPCKSFCRSYSECAGFELNMGTHGQYSGCTFHSVESNTITGFKSGTKNSYYVSSRSAPVAIQPRDLSTRSKKTQIAAAIATQLGVDASRVSVGIISAKGIGVSISYTVANVPTVNEAATETLMKTSDNAGVLAILKTIGVPDAIAVTSGGDPSSTKDHLNFKKCPPGEGVVTVGTATANTVCGACPAGKFSGVSSATEACKDQKSCGVGKGAKKSTFVVKDSGVCKRIITTQEDCNEASAEIGASARDSSTCKTLSSGKAVGSLGSPVADKPWKILSTDRMYAYGINKVWDRDVNTGALSNERSLGIADEEPVGVYGAKFFTWKYTDGDSYGWLNEYTRDFQNGLITGQPYNALHVQVRPRAFVFTPRQSDGSWYYYYQVYNEKDGIYECQSYGSAWSGWLEDASCAKKSWTGTSSYNTPQEVTALVYTGESNNILGYGVRDTSSSASKHGLFHFKFNSNKYHVDSDLGQNGQLQQAVGLDRLFDGGALMLDFENERIISATYNPNGNPRSIKTEVSVPGMNGGAIAVSPDQKMVYVLDKANKKLYHYELSGVHDLTLKSETSYDGTIDDIRMDPRGKLIAITGDTAVAYPLAGLVCSDGNCLCKATGASQCKIKSSRSMGRKYCAPNSGKWSTDRIINQADFKPRPECAEQVTILGDGLNRKASCASAQYVDYQGIQSTDYQNDARTFKGLKFGISTEAEYEQKCAQSCHLTDVWYPYVYNDALKVGRHTRTLNAFTLERDPALKSYSCTCYYASEAALTYHFDDASGQTECETIHGGSTYNYADPHLSNKQWNIGVFECETTTGPAASGSSSSDVGLCESCKEQTVVAKMLAKPGTYNDEDGSSGCKTASTECPAGFEIGTLSTTSADAQCTACPSGKFKTSTGADVCIERTKCPAGQGAVTYSTTLDTTCAACVSGTTYSNEDSNTQICKATTPPCDTANNYTEVISPSASANRVCALIDQFAEIQSGEHGQTANTKDIVSSADGKIAAMLLTGLQNTFLATTNRYDGYNFKQHHQQSKNWPSTSAGGWAYMTYPFAFGNQILPGNARFFRYSFSFLDHPLESTTSSLNDGFNARVYVNNYDAGGNYISERGHIMPGSGAVSFDMTEDGNFIMVGGYKGSGKWGYSIYRYGEEYGTSEGHSNFKRVKDFTEANSNYRCTGIEVAVANNKKFVPSGWTSNVVWAYARNDFSSLPSFSGSPVKATSAIDTKIYVGTFADSSGSDVSTSKLLPDAIRVGASIDLKASGNKVTLATSYVGLDYEIGIAVQTNTLNLDGSIVLGDFAKQDSASSLDYQTNGPIRWDIPSNEQYFTMGQYNEYTSSDFGFYGYSLLEVSVSGDQSTVAFVCDPTGSTSHSRSVSTQINAQKAHHYYPPTNCDGFVKVWSYDSASKTFSPKGNTVAKGGKYAMELSTDGNSLLGSTGGRTMKYTFDNDIGWVPGSNEIVSDVYYDDGSAASVNMGTETQAATQMGNNLLVLYSNGDVTDKKTLKSYDLNAPCPTGQFVGANGCEPLTKCPPGQGANPGTGTHRIDSVCEPCNDGVTYSDDTSSSMCKPVSTCPVGTQEDRAARRSADLTCKNFCPNDFYLDTSDLKCKPVQICQVHQFEYTAPTATANRVCHTDPNKFTSQSNFNSRLRSCASGTGYTVSWHYFGTWQSSGGHFYWNGGSFYPRTHAGYYTWNHDNNYCDIANWQITPVVTDLTGLFNLPFMPKNLDLSSWDTSGVTNIDYMFAKLDRVEDDERLYPNRNTNQNPNYETYKNNGFDSRSGEPFEYLKTLSGLDQWDLSNVESANGLFYGFGYHLGSISGTTFSGYQYSFNTADHYATALTSKPWFMNFVKNLGAGGKLKSLYRTFEDAYGFKDTDVDLTAWDVSSVTNMDKFMEDIGSGSGLSDPASINLSGWDMNKVTNFKEAFKNAARNIDIDVTNTACCGSATTLQATFKDCYKFTGSGLESWQVHNVQQMLETFSTAKVFNADISSWNTASVRSLNYAFYKAEAFNQPIGVWDTSSVSYLSYVFLGDQNVFNQDLTDWDVSKVFESSQFDSGCMSFKDVGGTKYLEGTNCPPKASPNNICTCTNGVGSRGSACATDGAEDCTACDVGYGFTTGRLCRGCDCLNGVGAVGDACPSQGASKCASCDNHYKLDGDACAFSFQPSSNSVLRTAVNDCIALNPDGSQCPPEYGPIGSWDVSSIADFRWVFQQKASFDQDLSTWDVGYGYKFDYMFDGATAFNNGGQPLNWRARETSGSFNRMFKKAASFNQDVSNLATPGTISNGLEYMFHEAKAFNNGGQPLVWPSLPLVNAMEKTFQYCETLNVDLSGIDTSTVKSMEYTFLGAVNFDNGGMSLTWDTSAVTDFIGAFKDASSFNQAVPFDMRRVTEARNMFDGATAFNQDVGNWRFDALLTTNNLFNMFKSTNMTYDLERWMTDGAIPSSVVYVHNSQSISDSPCGFAISSSGYVSENTGAACVPSTAPVVKFCQCATGAAASGDDCPEDNAYLCKVDVAASGGAASGGAAAAVTINQANHEAVAVNKIVQSAKSDKQVLTQQEETDFKAQKLSAAAEVRKAFNARRTELGDRIRAMKDLARQAMTQRMAAFANVQKTRTQRRKLVKESIVEITKDDLTQTRRTRMCRGPLCKPRVATGLDNKNEADTCAQGASSDNCCSYDVSDDDAGTVTILTPFGQDGWTVFCDNNTILSKQTMTRKTNKYAESRYTMQCWDATTLSWGAEVTGLTPESTDYQCNNRWVVIGSQSMFDCTGSQYYDNATSGNRRRLAAVSGDAVYVSGGDTSDPYYTFYTNASCSSGQINKDADGTYHLKENTSYTFVRCNDATTHPFDVYAEGGTGATTGISGTETLALATVNAGDRYTWKCTSHSVMTGTFKAISTAAAATNTAASQCVELTVCGTGEYESVAATMTSDRTCTPYTSCAAGKGVSVVGGVTTDYQCEDCAAGTTFSAVDGFDACQAVTACAAPMIEDAAPTASSDRTCAMPAGASCGAGEYESGAGCANLTVCADFEYDKNDVAVDGSSTQDRDCAMKSTCPSGQGVKATSQGVKATSGVYNEYTVSPIALCGADWSAHNSDAYVWSTLPAGFSSINQGISLLIDGSDEAAAIAAAKSAADSINAISFDYKPDTGGLFRFFFFTDGNCGQTHSESWMVTQGFKRYDLASGGSRRLSHAKLAHMERLNRVRRLADTECEACVAGTTFSNSDSLEACQTVNATCVAPLVEKVAPTAENNRWCCAADEYACEATGTCETYTACTADEFESVAPTGKFDRTCLTHSACPIGKGVLTNGTATADTVCESCVEGSTYSSVADDIRSCVAVSQCAIGEGVSQNATTSSDVVCSPCAAGTVKDAVGNTACQAASTCPAGEGVQTVATTSVDTVCAACDGVTTFSASDSADACQDVTVCGAGFQKAADATASNDVTCDACTADTFKPAAGNTATCQAHSAACGAGFVEIQAATTEQDRICCADTEYHNGTHCNAHTVACGAGQIEIQAASSSQDRICCATGEYHDGTQCATLTACQAWEYISANETTTSDRACADRSTCPIGQGFVSAGNAYSNTECEACVGDTYSDLANFDACDTHTDCSATGKLVDEEGTASADTVCVDSASSCASDQYKTRDANATHNTNCSNCTVCAAGEYATSACSASADTVCDACAAETFKATAGNEACTAVSTCSGGQVTDSAATATSNTTCKAPTVCGADEYESVALAAPTTDRQCSACSSCPVGQGVSTLCTAAADTVCEPCNSNNVATGGSDQTGTFSSVADKLSECEFWSSCTTGHSVVQQPSATHNRGCEFRPSTYSALKAAVDQCLAADATGATGCALSGNSDMVTWNLLDYVGNMDELFKDAAQFNAAISSWDVSGVTSMKGMFHGGAAFDQDISAWDVSGVENMESMFEGATSFNQDVVGDANFGWNVGNVVNMKRMFYGATAYAQTMECGQWDTARDSEDIDTESMFVGTSSAAFAELAGYTATVDMAIISDNIRLMKNKGTDKRYYQIMKQPLLQKQLPAKLEGCEAHHVGSTVATSANGRVMAVGGYETDNNGCWQRDDIGAVFVYRLESDDIWRKMGKLVPGAECDNQFGYSLDISEDGKFIAVGSPYCDTNANGAAHLFVFDGEMGSLADEHRTADSPVLDTATATRPNRWTRYANHQVGAAMGDQFGYAVSVANSNSGRKLRAGSLAGEDLEVYWASSAPAAENTDKSYFMIRGYPESVANDNKKLHKRFFDDSDATLVGGQSLALKAPAGGFSLASTMWEDKSSIGGTVGFKAIVFNLADSVFDDDFDVSVVGTSTNGRVEWPLGTSEAPDASSTDPVEKMGLVDLSVDMSADGQTIAIGYGGKEASGYTAGNADGAVKVFQLDSDTFVAKGEAITGEFPLGGKDRLSLSGDGKMVMVGSGRFRPMHAELDTAKAFGFATNNADWRASIKIYQYSKGGWVGSFDEIFHPTDTVGTCDATCDSACKTGDLCKAEIKSAHLSSDGSKLIVAYNTNEVFVYRFNSKTGHECPYLPSQIVQSVCYTGTAVTAQTMNSAAMQADILQKLQDALPHATKITVGTFMNVPAEMCAGQRRRLIADIGDEDETKALVLGRRLAEYAVTDAEQPTVIEGPLTSEDESTAGATITAQADAAGASTWVGNTQGDFTNAQATECINNPYASNDCCEILRNVHGNSHCCGRNSESCNIILNAYDIACAWCCS